MKAMLTKTLGLYVALMLVACGGKQAKKGVETAQADIPTSTLEIEKPQLTFGFIKLTDMAPLAIAKEKGFFEDEGLFVSVEAQSNWKNVLDRVIADSRWQPASLHSRVAHWNGIVPEDWTEEGAKRI